jgi:ATP-binding cassette, subfamily B, bacterial PglK
MKSIIELLRECNVILGKAVRRRLLGLFCCFLAASLLELMGFGLIVPFLSGLVAPETLSQLWFPRGLAHGLASPSGTAILVCMGAAIISAFTAKAFAIVWINRAILRFSFAEQARLQRLLLGHYRNLPYEDHLQRNSSELVFAVTRLTVGFAQGVMIVGLRLTAEATLAIGILALLTIRAPWAVLAILVLLAGVGVGYDRRFRRKAVQLGIVSNAAQHRLIIAINHILDGFKELTVLGHQEYFHRLADGCVTQSAEAGTESGVLQVIPRQVLELTAASFIIGLAICQIATHSDRAEIVATLGLFSVAAARLTPSANFVLGALQSLRFGRDTARRLHAKFEEFDGTATTLGSQSDAQPRNRVDVFRRLELRDVTFRYRSRRTPAIDAVNLTINAGEAIGLVGTSGAGKTTLVDVMLGFLKPNHGAVLVNGRPLEEDCRRWLDCVAYLPQAVFLADDTLRRNVALGLDDLAIDESRVLASLRRSRLGELVQELPNGLDTMIGEGGVRLSGGQRQRVALARAFYQRRDVLILDEATSALDTETEREIVNDIKRLKGEQTLIVIAHRLSTVAHCDRIIRLEHGRVAGWRHSEGVNSDDIA